MTAPWSDPQAIKDRLDAHGYALCRGAVHSDLGRAIGHAFAAARSDAGGSRRLVADHPAVRSLLQSKTVKTITQALLGRGARPVRALAFDKTPRRNWAVAWHQDRTIAVAERQDVAPVSSWTEKAGKPHCEAPVALLERMVTLRWHLDPCGPDQGGLRVLPGSHRLGRLCQAEIAELRQEIAPVELDVPAGALLVMRPLLVHGSRRCRAAARRRVLHVELADCEPPAPLRWA